MYYVLQKVVLKCLIRSECITDVLKLMVLSYLFFNLCWDFNYYELCSDIETGILDFKTYDFENIQDPPSETKKGEI